MLFSPLTIRSLTLRNRIAVSPMCQYSSTGGFASDWHLVHYGGRAVGGAGLIIVEATAVEPRGRISPFDLGLWTDEQIPGLARITAFLKEHGAAAGIQIAHAGRKASTARLWEGEKPLTAATGGWETVAPSALPFDEKRAAPREFSRAEIHDIVEAFGAAARRALAAGFHVVELHGAHGYLIHEFLSPLANRRTDEYGGSFENRIRFALEVTAAVRTTWPDTLPLIVRLSAQDWAEGGWTLAESIELAKRLKPLGVDLIDTSSGGMVPHAKMDIHPGYQVPFAAAVRRGADILTGAVGLITDPHQAESILGSGDADLVLLGREFLRDAYWPLHAARTLGVKVAAPAQYERGFI
jgi:2,4-dienoyl-CoA reductase-like NADH-dependent reductase (Old Yellow Enzyme family)